MWKIDFGSGTGWQDGMASPHTLRVEKNLVTWGTKTVVPETRVSLATRTLVLAGNSDGQPFSAYQNMYIYSWKIYESDNGQKGGPNQVLKHDYIPVKNSSDVPGLYDLVTGEFYSSTSGTNFEPGPEVDPSTLTFLQRLALDSRRVSADADTRAEGGDIVLEDGDDYIHIFTSTVGSQSFTVKQPCSATALLVGGGGGGGNNAGGGGGGGGVTAVLEPNALTPGSLEVIVGAGGAAALNSTVQGTAGGASSIGNLGSAPGGKGGYGWNRTDGNQFKGGTAGTGGGNGGNAGSTNKSSGSPGIEGSISLILGGSTTFGGGGGGGAQSNNDPSDFYGGDGGSGGGGKGCSVANGSNYASAGEAGLGGGGGGGAGGVNNFSDKAARLEGGRGGDGIVIIRVSAPAVTPVERPAHAWGGDDKTKVYTGNSQKATYSENPGYEITYDPTGDWKNVGDYKVTFALKSGYVWASGDDVSSPIEYTHTITKASLTATAQDKTVTYGDNPPSYTVTYSGFVGADQSSAPSPTTAPALTSSYSTTTDAGTNPAITFSTAPVFANYDVTTHNGTVTVNKRTLTVTGLTATGRAYDGTTTVPLTGTLSGVVNSDDVTLGGLTGTIADKNAGTGKTVTPGALSLSGAKAGNYTLTQPTGPLTVTITQKEAMLAWTNKSFSYDGQSHKPDCSVSNLVSGDNCTVTVTGEQTDQGTYTATATGLSNINYKLPTATTCQFTITGKALADSMVSLIKTSAEVGAEGWDTLPTVTVKDGATTLIEGTHYTKNWSPASVTGAGVYTCTVTGKGNYSGTVEKTYTVTDPNAVPLPRLVRDNFVYDGRVKTVEFVSTEGFTAVGTMTATEIDEYEITCTPVSGKHWEGGSTDPVKVTWRITPGDTRTFLQKLADDPRRVMTGFDAYATGGDIILKEGDEYIHVFTNSATFTVAQSGGLTARVLLVAGGGSSGSPEYGVAGGGGAGGMVYNAAVAISQGGHSVTVGKGGVSSASATQPTGTAVMSKYGQNGGNSSIAGTGLTATGGGRGAENDWGNIGGALGGSGGGGGYAKGAQGNGTSGQGNQGGDNDTNAAYNGFMTGGGGGAGSAGHNFGNSYRWAQGGDGMNCDILGFNQVFAGGGSGYTAAMTDLPGGLGGGGSWSYEFMRGGNGENGLGGGASGANSASGMYRGGDGIVIVRYSTATLAKTVLVPEPIEGLVYTGWEQTGVPKGKGYSIVNETGFSAKATDAGHYTAKVRVDSGYTWKDGSTEDKQIEWTIAPYDLSTSHGMVFGAKDMMAMGATVTPTWNFVLNTATIGSSQWEVGDWDGAFVNPGTYHGKLRPSATGTNFTGERDITFTIQAAVKTYYLVGSDGTEFSSFNGVSTKTSSTTTEPTVGWSTEPNGAVDVDHTVKANFDYVIPAGAGLRNPYNKEKTHNFLGASLEVRGGSLNLQADDRVQGDGYKWRLVDYSVAVKRFIFDGGGANDTNDGINWAVKAENGFEIRSGGAVIGLTAQNSRYITLIGDLTRYEAGGNLTIRTTHTGDNGYTRSLAIDGDWSKFAGDIVAEPVVKSPVRFYLGVAGAFGGKVQSLPPVRNVTESYIIFNYDKLRNAQRGLEVNTNDLSAVSLLKTRLWLTTSKAATTKNLPIMTFPAGTTVNAGDFTVYRLASYKVNKQPDLATEGFGSEMFVKPYGTRTNDDGTITLYANFSNNIADFDVTCPSQVRTGSPLTPVVTVKLAGRTLVKGTDYTIGAWTPSGLTETGDYTATITGLGDYEDTSKDVTFTIVAAGSVDLKDHIDVTSYDGIYDGNPHTVTITLRDEKSAGATVKFGLTEGVYDLNAAPNPTLPYDATVYYQVSKEGCTTATGSEKLRITALQNTWNGTPSISKSEWTAGDAAGTVTGATTTYGNVRSYLQLHGTSVSNLWSYAMPQVPGVYKLYFVPEEVPGVNPPDPAAKSLTFTIKGAMPSSVTAQSQVYTGESITAPAYTVIYTVPGKGVTRTLVKGVDFDEGTWSGPLTDGQMINAGVYTLTLTGKNPYTGSTPVSFTIEKAQNEWTQDPAITPATWSTTDAYGTLTPGKTKFGAVAATYTANYSDSTSASGDFTSLDDPAFKKAGSFTITYAAPAATANYDAPNVPSKSVAFTITQGVYTYGKYETLSAAGGAYTVIEGAAYGTDDEIDKAPVDTTAYANSGDDLWMFHDGTAPVEATFNHFRIIDTDGQLQHNLVPARQVESGKDGFYDTVTKAFFANASAVQGAALTAENNVTPTVARPNLTTTVRETGDEIDILEGVNAANMTGILAHGTTKATEPGTYTFALTPDDEHVWADGTFATIPYTWTITEDTREEVAKPYALDPPAQYNGGNAVNGIAYDSALLGTRYAIAGDGTSATAAGSYHSTATLLDPDSYRWQGTHESVLEIDWQIAKGANEWTTTLTLPSSWEPGQTVSFTQPIAKFGTAQASLKRPGGNTFEPWSPDFGSLTENGDYQVRFAVAEDANWTAIEVVQGFRIKDGTMKDDIKAADVKVFYDGKPHGITVTLEGSAVGATLKFWNEATSAYDLDVSPTQTAVGVLTVKYQVSKTGKQTVTDSRTVTVTAKPLTVKDLAATDRVYNGTVNVVLTGTLDGVVGGDTVTLGGLTGTMADKNAGSNKTVTPGMLTLDGADAGNYTLTQPTGTLTVNISQKELTVQGLAATDRVYDGTTTVALTGGSLKDVISGDSVTCTMPTSGTIADANVGTGKTVSFADLTLGGADAGNYALTQPTHPTVDIEAATITAVTLAADSAEWTGKAITPTVTSVTANGKAFTDSSVGWSVSYKKGGSGVSEIVDIGEYKVVVTGTANLTGTAEATFTVTKPSSYRLSAIELGGPKVAVDTDWLEAAFPTAEATQAGYQSAFISTNSNGVTAWAAYILGFDGDKVSTAAIIEKTTGSTTDGDGNVMLTVELPDLPKTKPTVANCTVSYSLLTSDNAETLRTGGGTNAVDAAGKKCEKCAEPTFSVPAPTTGNHAYYRIRVHFIFGGGGEVVILAPSGPVTFGQDGWLMDGELDWSWQDLNVPASIATDGGWLRLTFDATRTEKLGFQGFGCKDSEAKQLYTVQAKEGYANQIIGYSFMDGLFSGDDISYDRAYFVPPGTGTAKVRVYFERSGVGDDTGDVRNHLSVSDVGVSVIDEATALEVADKCYNVFATDYQRAVTAQPPSIFKPENAPILRSVLRNGHTGSYKILFLGDSILWDSVNGQLPALLHREFASANIEVSYVAYTNGGAIDFLEHIETPDFSQYDCVIYGGSCVVRNHTAESDYKTYTPKLLQAIRQAGCEVVIFPALLCCEPRSDNTNYQNNYWDASYLAPFVGQAWTPTTTLPEVNWWYDVQEYSSAYKTYFEAECVKSGQEAAICNPIKMIESFLWGSSFPLAWHLRDAIHNNEYGKQFNARLIVECLKAIRNSAN